MRISKKQKRILELLKDFRNVDYLVKAHVEPFTFRHIYAELYGEVDVSKSRKSALFHSLKTLVENGIVEKGSVSIEYEDKQYPTQHDNVLTFHLAGHLHDDKQAVSDAKRRKRDWKHLKELIEKA